MLAFVPNPNGDAPLLPPNVKAFEAAGGCCVAPGKFEADVVMVELPKTVCVVVASMVVAGALAVMPNPPNDMEVEFWLADSWPNVNELWACGAGAGFAAPNCKAELVPPALAVVVLAAGAAVVVGAAPNCKEGFTERADVVVAFQPPKRDWLGACVAGGGPAKEVDTAGG